MTLLCVVTREKLCKLFLLDVQNPLDMSDVFFFSLLLDKLFHSLWSVEEQSKKILNMSMII